MAATLLDFDGVVDCLVDVGHADDGHDGHDALRGNNRAAIFEPEGSY